MENKEEIEIWKNTQLEDLPNEEWKDVEGYDGQYRVSNLGRVKSLGNDKSRKTKILRQHDNTSGYLIVNLCKNGKMKTKLVHRLVLEVFVPNTKNLSDANHVNEKKHDCRLSNLEWLSHRENCNFGTHNARMAASRSISVVQLTKQYEFVRTWASSMEVHRVCGFNQGNIISSCRGIYKTSHGYIWRYASEYFNDSDTSLTLDNEQPSPTENIEYQSQTSILPQPTIKQYLFDALF